MVNCFRAKQPKIEIWTAETGTWTAETGTWTAETGSRSKDFSLARAQNAEPVFDELGLGLLPVFSGNALLVGDGSHQTRPQDADP